MESGYYAHYNANVHRGVHTLSQRATDAYEAARRKVQRFINAGVPEEIVFVGGTTDAINLVAQSFARPILKAGHEILISAMEHHSNIVPWQLVCAQTGANLRVVPINDAGEFEFDAYEKLVGPRTKLVAVTHVSNALGSITPIERIIALAHARNVPVLVDGAQAVSHLPVDVHALDCDFYAFSGHKIFGPTGIGALHGKAAHLQAMPPYQGGGDMIRSVTFEKTEYNDIPYKFEAGTPNIAGAIGMGCALDYVSQLGIEAIEAHNLRLADRFRAGLEELAIETERFPEAERSPVVAMTLTDPEATIARLALAGVVGALRADGDRAGDPGAADNDAAAPTRTQRTPALRPPAPRAPAHRPSVTAARRGRRTRA